MTLAEVIAAAKQLGFDAVYHKGRVPLDTWKPGRSAKYDGFKLVGGEIIVDETRDEWGGAWPLLRPAPPSTS